MVIVRIAKNWSNENPESIRAAIADAISKASRMAIEHGYYRLAMSKSSSSQYFGKSRHPRPEEILRISDHPSFVGKAIRSVQIVFPGTLVEGRRGDMFFANAMDDRSIEEAFMLADSEVQNRTTMAEPALVASWLAQVCRFA